MRGGAISLAAALGVSAPAALACSIAPHAPTNGAERGEACEVTWRPDEYRAITLSRATDLGQGYLRQTAADGNGCYSEVYAVVMDCTQGQALVIGPYQFDLMARMENPGRVPPLEKVMNRIDTAAGQGAPLTLDAVEGEARGAGLTTQLRLRTRDAINLNRQRIALGCGCRTFYPGLGPGN